MREKILLICSECLSRNYVTSKIKGATQERFTVNKFCPQCNKHTLHKESK